MIPMTWRIKRWAISAFLLFHVAAVAVWNFPKGAIHDRVVPHLVAYMLPTGLWQNWTMFGPTLCGTRSCSRRWPSTRTGSCTSSPSRSSPITASADAIPRVRHSKFPTYLMIPDYASHREMVARYVVRKLNLPPESFPVDVELQYAIKEAPAAGAGARPDGPDQGRADQGLPVPHMGGGAPVMSRLLRPWNRFWFAPISARPLGAFRVVFGVLADLQPPLHDGRLRLLAHEPRHPPGPGGAPGRRAHAAVAPELVPRSHLRPRRLRRDARRRGGPDARLAHEGDEHPVLPGDALDPSPQPAHGKRRRHAARSASRST